MSRAIRAGKGMGKKDSENQGRPEVSLPEVLWGQEIHWGPEAQEDPRGRAGLSQENGVGSEHRAPSGVRGSCPTQAPGEQWGGLGARRLQPHSPFLQGAHGGHHHLTFPAGETESEEPLSSFP